MIRVRENADGTKRYDVRLRGSNGRVVTKTFARRRAAERWERDQLAARDDGSWVDRRLGRQPLSDWFAEWWPTRTDLDRRRRPATSRTTATTCSPCSAISRSHRSTTHWSPHGSPSCNTRGSHPPRCADATCCCPSSWPAPCIPSGSRATPAPTPTTCRRSTGPRCESSTPNRSSASPTPWPTSRRNAWADACRAPAATTTPSGESQIGFRRWSSSAGYGGLRFGELAGLRRDRIETPRRMVRVDPTLTEVRGQLILGRPKTAAGVRSVPLPRTAVARLERAARGLDTTSWSSPGPTAHRSEPARSGPGSGSRPRARPTSSAWHARPSSHGRLVVDRPRCLGEAGPGVGWSPLGRHRLRPPRAPVPRRRGPGDGLPGRRSTATAVLTRPQITREIRAMDRGRSSPAGRMETPRPFQRKGSRRGCGGGRNRTRTCDLCRVKAAL